VREESIIPIAESSASSPEETWSPVARNHQGRIALITGAHKGIGYEVARQLGREGVIALVAARNPELGEAHAAKLRAGGADAHFIELDADRSCNRSLPAWRDCTGTALPRWIARRS